MSHSHKYTLTYFNSKGSAEFIRYLFAYVNQEYEDFRFEFKNWTQFVPFTLFNQVPVLELKDEKNSTCCEV